MSWDKSVWPFLTSGSMEATPNHKSASLTSVAHQRTRSSVLSRKSKRWRSILAMSTSEQTCNVRWIPSRRRLLEDSRSGLRHELFDDLGVFFPFSLHA